MTSEMTPDLMRAAYQQGLFPMADSRDPAAELAWYKSSVRAVFRPQSFHIPRSLAKFIRKECSFELRWNDDLRAVMTGCRDTRGSTWINTPLIEAFVHWQQASGDVYCLSVFRDGQRVGGIYGVQLGALCTAESMFSLVPNASSVALVVLMAGLAKTGIKVLDAQVANDHTRRFHPEEWPDDIYQQVLQALRKEKVMLDPVYFCADFSVDFSLGNSLIQSLTQTS